MATGELSKGTVILGRCLLLPTSSSDRTSSTASGRRALPEAGASDRDAAFQAFLDSYPEYADTAYLDQLRSREFSRLDRQGHAYLDYTGSGKAAVDPNGRGTHVAGIIAGYAAGTNAKPLVAVRFERDQKGDVAERREQPVVGPGDRVDHVDAFAETIVGPEFRQVAVRLSRQSLNFLASDQDTYARAQRSSSSIASRAISVR